MNGWKGMLWTLGLVFVVTVAQAFLNAGGDLFNMEWSSWQLAINAGVGAILALGINFAMPFITRYGIGSKTE